MGRIRTIKPEFWIDEKIGDLKMEERLLLIGLLNLADDEGVLKANPAFIKGQILPYDEIDISEIKAWLTSLENGKFIISFSYNQENFFLIRTFRNHQKINRPSPSKVPLNIIKGLINDDSLNTHGDISEDSLAERKGKEGNKEGKGEGKEGNSLTPQTNNSDLENSILKFFGFNEISNYDKLRQASEFCYCLKKNNRLEYFQQQFEAYKKYKKTNAEWSHSFKNFLGSHEKLFEDGAWNAENWNHKLSEHQKANQNGKSNTKNSNSNSNFEARTADRHELDKLAKQVLFQKLNQDPD